MTARSVSVVCLAFFLLPMSADAAGKKKLPEFAAVKSTVQKTIAGKKGYKTNDLISRGDVEKALKAVDKLGWEVDDAKDILEDTLADNDYLVQQLRTKRGTTFMRKLSGTPETYDRLDRLRKLPYGERRVREFIANPGGHTMILYMATTPGGKNLGKYLSKTNEGKNFNKETGRIYTEKDLVERLKKSYETAQTPGKAGSKSKKKTGKPTIVR